MSLTSSNKLNNLFRYLLYKRARFLVRSRRLINKKLTSDAGVCTETQQLAIAVIKRAINFNNSELLIAPLSGTRYVHVNDIFIRIEFRDVTIIDGIYSYHVTIPDYYADKIYRKFNLKLETRRKLWETSILTKTNRSLSSILKDFEKISTTNIVLK